MADVAISTKPVTHVSRSDHSYQQYPSLAVPGESKS